MLWLPGVVWLYVGGRIVWPAHYRLALNTSLFEGRHILEIGAGNALCGVTVASYAAHVTLSDFNEVVLKNIKNIVDLNSGQYEMTYCSGGNNMPCLNTNTNIEVCTHHARIH